MRQSPRSSTSPRTESAMPRLAAILLCGVAFVSHPAPAHAEDVPDPSPNALRFPAAVKAGRPDAIKPGMRLTYSGTSATVSGQCILLALDSRGNWVVRETEKRWETGNSGGVGYTVVRVCHIDDEVAAVSTSAYLLDLATNAVCAAANDGFVSQAGCAGTYWIHPAALAKLQDSKQAGQLVLRMPYVVNNRTYNAIRLTTEGAKSYTAQVFDLDTGILIFYAAASISDPSFVKLPNGQARKIEGSTHTETAGLMEVKDVGVPWRDRRAPTWVGTFEELRYEGSVSAVSNGAEYSQATSATITPVARGEGWLRCSLASVTQNPGLPPYEVRGNLAAGNGSLGGLWIPPNGIDDLEEGQVIETNDVTGTRTVVSRVANGLVTITETGKIFQVDTTYDSKTGLMSEIVVSQQTAVGLRTTRLRLVGTK